MVATPSRWKPFIGLGVALAAAAPATSAMAVGPQAALGWRIVYRHVTTNYFSSYRAVATSGLSHAWAVGGTGLARYGSPLAGPIAPGQQCREADAAADRRLLLPRHLALGTRRTVAERLRS